MLKRFSFLAVLAIVVVCTMGASKCAKQKQGVYSALDHIGIPRHEALFRYEYKTPKGVRIASVDAVTPEAMAAVDRGITKTIECTKILFPHWTFARNPSDIGVLFVKPRGIIDFDEPKGAPTIFVNGIEAAGSAVGERRSGWPTKLLVLPSQGGIHKWKYLEYLENAARFETEHATANWNDLQGEWAKNLGANDWHPKYECGLAEKRSTLPHASPIDYAFDLPLPPGVKLAE